MPFDPTQIFEEYYDDIKKVIQSVSRKKTNQPQEIEECVSYIFEQLFFEKKHTSTKKRHFFSLS